MKLLMISGDRSLAQGKKGAFYNTLEEFHKYWERIDIIIPRARGPASPHPHGAQLLFARHGGPPVESPLAFFDNVFLHSSPWPLIFQPWWILKRGLKIYKEQKFDLMTVHEYPPFYNGIGARLLWNKIHPVKSGGAGASPVKSSEEFNRGKQFDGVKIPYVLEIFHIPGYQKAANLKERIYRSLFCLFIGYDCRKAKAVRVMNNQVAAKLIDLGIPESKINLIPAIYVDLDIFKPMGLEKKYDLIFIGRLAKNKGINLFLEAVKRLNCKAVIVGDGPLKESIRFKIENLKLQDKVIFYGWAKDSEEIAKLLNQSKVLVMPSYNEGGPRVIIEAMACGLPILATPVGIVADRPDAEIDVLLKPPLLHRPSHWPLITIDWNPRDIAEKAQSLLLLFNESEYQKYSEAALKMAERFEKKSAIRNYAEKLQELI